MKAKEILKEIMQESANPRNSLIPEKGKAYDFPLRWQQDETINFSPESPYTPYLFVGFFGFFSNLVKPHEYWILILELYGLQFQMRLCVVLRKSDTPLVSHILSTRILGCGRQRDMNSKKPTD